MMNTLTHGDIEMISTDDPPPPGRTRTESISKRNPEYLEEELRKASARLELVRHLSMKTTVLQGTLDPDGLLQHAVNHISKHFDYYDVSVRLVEGNFVVLRAATRPLFREMIEKHRIKNLDLKEVLDKYGNAIASGDKQRIQYYRRIFKDISPRKGGIIGWVIADKSKSFKLVNDVKNDPDNLFRTSLKNSKTQAELALPMIVNDKVIGVLDVQSDTAGAFSDADIEFLMPVAALLAEAIHRTHVDVNALSQIFSGNPVPTFVIGKDHSIIYWNQACENLMELTAEEMVGSKKQWKPFYRRRRSVLADFIIDGKPLKEMKDFYGPTLREYTRIRGAFRSESFFKLLKGKENRWFMATAAPLRDATGNEVVGAIETIQDITESKLRESQWNTLFRQSIEAIVLTDINGRIIDVNRKFTRVFGRRKKDIMGKHIDDIVAPRWKDKDKKLHEEARSYSRQVLAGKSIRKETIRYRKKKGRLVRFHVELVGSPMKIEDRVVGIYNIYRDITDRVEAQVKLHQLFKNSLEAIVRTDTLGRFQDANPAFYRMFGYRKGEIRKGDSFDDLVAPRGENEAQLNKEAHRFTKCVAGGERIAKETKRLNNATGNWLHVSLLGLPIFSPDGESVDGIYNIYRDITERFEAQELLADTTRGVAHNLKTHFQQIIYVLEQLTVDPSGFGDEKPPADCNPINTAFVISEHGYDVATRLYKHALLGKREPHIRDIDTFRLIKNLERTNHKERNAGMDYTVNVVIKGGRVKWPTIQSDEVLLEEIFHILIDNGIKYNREYSRRIVLSCSVRKKSNCVVFSVIDNGLGIRIKDQGKVFKLLERGKNCVQIEDGEIIEIEGNGIGLSYAKDAAEVLHGELTIVKSIINNGTTFSVKFPLR